MGGVTYAACVIWRPLDLDSPTALIAAVGVALCWALIAGVFADSRQSVEKA